MEHGGRACGTVLVVGAGIAGLVAAIEAARAGAHVTLACEGRVFGGSSFYPGTWGLGLVGPLDESDEDDLIASIIAVGCGVANPALVEAFVCGIGPAIDWLENDLGVKLKRPATNESASEAAFIPCFDHKHRLWRGITRAEFVRAVRCELERLDVEVLERHELLALLDASGMPLRGGFSDTAVGGACLFDRSEELMRTVAADAVVLAAGGTSGLFERSLTAPDVLSSVHGIALDAGCALVNVEFMQMMPGLVAPKRGLVFNEKTFRYVRLRHGGGLLPSDEDDMRRLLEVRSSHGPFTARLGDEAVDLAIDAAGPEGLALTYEFPSRDVPEFVQTFSAWLAQEHGISPRDELRVAMYAHASNGGIAISPEAHSGVSGLFACGEVTGGMHGADRIGGLSSANGLVFGRRAGKEAAAYACERAEAGTAPRHGGEAMVAEGMPVLDAATARAYTERLRSVMSAHAMILRTDEGLASGLAELDAMRRKLDACGVARTPGNSARGMRLRSQIALASAMLEAMRARTESLGSHYRADAV